MLNIKTFTVNPFQENTYVVSDDSNEAVIIDCGVLFEDERQQLAEYIESKQLRVVMALSTHGHIDHNFGNNTVEELYNLKPCVHTADKPLMDNLALQARNYCNYTLDYRMPEVGKYLNDGDMLSFGNHEVKVIHTPGHSPGSVVFYFEDEQLAFTGDTIFRMSIGRTDLEGGSYREMLNSLAMLMKALPDETTLYAGHGPITTMGMEREFNLLKYLQS